MACTLTASAAAPEQAAPVQPAPAPTSPAATASVTGRRQEQPPAAREIGREGRRLPAAARYSASSTCRRRLRRWRTRSSTRACRPTGVESSQPRRHQPEQEQSAHAASQDGAATTAAMVERGRLSTPAMRRIEAKVSPHRSRVLSMPSARRPHRQRPSGRISEGWMLHCRELKGSRSLYDRAEREVS